MLLMHCTMLCIALEVHGYFARCVERMHGLV